MKRSLVTTLIIGVAVAGTVGGLHASGLIARFELAVTGLISNYVAATRIVSGKWQPGIVLPLSLGHRMARGGGMDCLFEAGPLAFVEKLLHRPIVEQRISPPPRRRNFVRSATERTRSERCRLRRCQ